MSKKSILVIFCEGKHDSAFLSVVLKSMGYKHFSKPMNQLPLCFSYILKKLGSLNTQELTLGKIADDRFIFPFPWIFEDDRTIVALYRLDGISRIINISSYLVLSDSVEKLVNKGIRADFFSEEVSSIQYRTVDELIERIIEKTSLSKLEEAIIRSNVTKQEIIDTIQVIFDAEKYVNPKEIDFTVPVHFSFFVDADKEGITNRLQSIKDKYVNYFKGIETNLQPFQPMPSSDGRNIGLFVFTKEQRGKNWEKDDKGNLEDVVLYILEKSVKYKTLLENSKAFVKNKINEPFYDKKNFDDKKATIGVAGQFKCEGEDLELILNRSDFLQFSDVSFKENPTVKQIKQFINEMFT